MRSVRQVLANSSKNKTKKKCEILHVPVLIKLSLSEIIVLTGLKYCLEFSSHSLAFTTLSKYFIEHNCVKHGFHSLHSFYSSNHTSRAEAKKRRNTTNNTDSTFFGVRCTSSYDYRLWHIVRILIHFTVAAIKHNDKPIYVLPVDNTQALARALF